MTLYERFLRQAKEQIALQNLTQAEVGRAIGLSRNAISKVMNSKVTLKGDKLLRLAMTLRISLDEIIFPKTDLVVDSMTMAQGLARYGVPEEEILQGIRNSARARKESER